MNKFLLGYISIIPISVIIIIVIYRIFNEKEDDTISIMIMSILWPLTLLIIIFGVFIGVCKSTVDFVFDTIIGKWGEKMFTYVIRGLLIGLILGSIVYVMLLIKIREIKKNRTIVKGKERNRPWKWRQSQRKNFGNLLKNILGN